MKKVIAYWLLMVLLGLAVGGCQATEPTTTTTEPTTTEPTTTTTPATATTTPASDVFEVAVVDNGYLPKIATVPVGTTVTWVHQSIIVHTVTSDAPLYDSGFLREGNSFSYTFDQSGTYEYHCTIHPTLRGTVVVE